VQVTTLPTATPIPKAMISVWQLFSSELTFSLDTEIEGESEMNNGRTLGLNADVLRAILIVAVGEGDWVGEDEFVNTHIPYVVISQTGPIPAHIPPIHQEGNGQSQWLLDKSKFGTAGRTTGNTPQSKFKFRILAIWNKIWDYSDHLNMVNNKSSFLQCLKRCEPSQRRNSPCQLIVEQISE
jgi:hypothetical protein